MHDDRLGFTTGFGPSAGFARSQPTRSAPPPAARQPARQLPPAPSPGAIPRATATPRPTHVPYYDPSRIIDPDRLTLVKDMTGRGDDSEGDSGHLGPGSSAGPFRATRGVPVAPPQQGLTGGQIAMLVALGFLVLGG